LFVANAYLLRRMQARGWLAALVELIFSHPPARQPALDLLSLAASSPRHWPALLKDATYLRAAAAICSSAAACSPPSPVEQSERHVERQLAQVMRLPTLLAEHSLREHAAGLLRLAPVELCTDEAVISDAFHTIIQLGCQLGGPWDVSTLLMSSLELDSSPTMTRAMLSAGVLDYILGQLQPGAASSSDTSRALHVLDMLLAGELQRPGRKEAEAAIGGAVVESGVFGNLVQQYIIGGCAQPATATAQRVVAGVVQSYAAALDTLSGNDLLQLLLWLLPYTLAGEAVQDDDEPIDPEGCWFQHGTASKEKQAVISLVCLHFLCLHFL
jgi:hypothetical protein